MRNIVKLVVVALLGSASLPAMAGTVRTPMCLQFPDTNTQVSCTGVVPVDSTTGNPLRWQDLMSGGGTSSGGGNTASGTVGSNAGTYASQTGYIGADGTLRNWVGDNAGHPAVSIFGTPVISGTVTANIGTTNGLALDSSLSTLNTTTNSLFKAGQSIGNTSFGISGTLPSFATTQTVNNNGAVTTSAPSYTSGQNAALSLTTAGALRVDGSAVTQPISGSIANTTFASTQSGTWTVGVNSSVLPTGAATETTLSAISGKLPTSLGAKPQAQALPVALSTDGPVGQQTDAAATTTDTTASSLIAQSKQTNVLSGITNTRLSTIITTLGSPFQAGGSIANTAFGVNNFPTFFGARLQDATGTAFGTSGNPVTVAGTITANVGTTNGLALDTTVSGLFKSGQSIGNTGFTINGTLPSFATTQTFNVGTTNGLALDTSVAAVTAAVTAEAATNSKAPISYTLLNNASASGSNVTIQSDGYLWDIRGTFTTATLITKDSAGNNLTLASVTSPGVTGVNIGSGTVQVVLTGGSAVYSKLVGLGGPLIAAPAVQQVDTIVKSSLTNRSTVIGFTATTSSASSASTSLAITTTSNFTNQAGVVSGIPTVGMIVSGSGINTGTTITAISVQSATTYTLTLSSAATVASGASVTSGGPQLVMSANVNRRGFSWQNRGTTECDLNTTGAATLGPDSMLIAGGSYYETKDSQSAPDAVSGICTTPATANFIREW